MRSSIKSFSQMAAAQFHDSEDDIFCVKTRQQQTAHPSQAGQCSAVGVSRAEKGWGVTWSATETSEPVPWLAGCRGAQCVKARQLSQEQQTWHRPVPVETNKGFFLIRRIIKLVCEMWHLFKQELLASYSENRLSLTHCLFSEVPMMIS